jgi:hypothetical protein
MIILSKSQFKDNHEIVYEIHDSQVKKSENNGKKKSDEKTEIDKLNEAIRDLKVSSVLK